MRRAIFSLTVLLVGCGSAPQPHSKTKPSQESVATATAPNPQISAEESAPNSSAPAEASASEPMDMVTLNSQVDSIYAQNKSLAPEQAQGMSVTTMKLIEASQAKDQKSVSELSSQLLSQALLGRQGFGLVDAGGLAKAIQDLVAAAVNADVAGILDAVEDIVAAVTA